MPEPERPGSCHACGVKLSPARLHALLRRRALERLLAETEGAEVTQADLAAALGRKGFPGTSRVTVTKDLKLLGAVRFAEVRYQLARNVKE